MSGNVHAEHLWEVANEPIVNKHFRDLKTLDAFVSSRCARMANDRQTLKGRTGFNFWPKIANAN